MLSTNPVEQAKPRSQPQVLALATNRHRLGAARRITGLPRPGVYEAAPYTCIVVVPGGHPDDRCIVQPSDPQPRMPVYAPEVRLIPRHQAPAKEAKEPDPKDGKTP